MRKVAPVGNVTVRKQAHVESDIIGHEEPVGNVTVRT